MREIPMTRPIELNTEVARVKVTPSTLQRNMEVAGYLPSYVGLRDSVGEGVNAVAALNETGGFVTNVIREFEPLP